MRPARSSSCGCRRCCQRGRNQVGPAFSTGVQHQQREAQAAGSAGGCADAKPPSPPLAAHPMLAPSRSRQRQPQPPAAFAATLGAAPRTSSSVAPRAAQCATAAQPARPRTGRSTSLSAAVCVPRQQLRQKRQRHFCEGPCRPSSCSMMPCASPGLTPLLAPRACVHTCKAALWPHRQVALQGAAAAVGWWRRKNGWRRVSARAPQHSPDRLHACIAKPHRAPWGA